MSSTPALSNPFATWRTRPGALKFRFPDGEDAAALVERLRWHEWRGQIVGPHGSGKSTLLAALVPALEAAHRRVHEVAMHDGQRRLGLSREDWRKLNSGDQLIVDGYEQLSRMARGCVAWRCRRRRCGLLVTTHRDLGLPTLCTMKPRLELAVDLVRELLPPGDETIRPVDVAAAWRRRGGNMRELLFDLYDLFERRRPAAD